MEDRESSTGPGVMGETRVSHHLSSASPCHLAGECVCDMDMLDIMDMFKYASHWGQTEFTTIFDTLPNDLKE